MCSEELGEECGVDGSVGRDQEECHADCGGCGVRAGGAFGRLVVRGKGIEEQEPSLVHLGDSLGFELLLSKAMREERA